MRLRILLLIVAVIAGSLLVPSVAQASTTGWECPHTDAQYYHPWLPFYNTHTKQVVLAEKGTYNPVQVLADSVKNAAFLGRSAWSPSCRYFAFALRTDTIMWDTLEQKQVGIFPRKGQFDPPYLDWSDTDNYVVASNYIGQYLWKIPSNEQIQLDDFQVWYFSPGYTWDIPHGQTLMFDGRYVVAFDVNTGKRIHKYISPFQSNVTEYAISPDGRTLTISDKYFNKWAVTFDRATGTVIDAKALADLPADQVQFSPDRRYLVVGGYNIDVYDVSEATTQTSYGWVPLFEQQSGYYTWRFVDSTTLEFDYTRTGQHRLYDLKARKFR